MSQNPYESPTTTDVTVEVITPDKSRNWAIAFSAALWAAVVALFNIEISMFVFIFLSTYTLVMLFIAIGSSERYLRNAKKSDSSGHVTFARILYFVNCAPIILFVLNLVGTFLV